MQRIRNCFGNDDNIQLSSEVEVDETYVGGKNKNRHFDKKVRHSQGRSFKDKTPVLGILQRGGKLIAKTVENVQVKILTQEILNNVKKDATVYTDEWIGYKEVSKTYNHSIVKHAQYQYVNVKHTQIQ